MDFKQPNVTPYYSSLLKLQFKSHRKRRKQGKNQNSKGNFIHFFKEIKICIQKNKFFPIICQLSEGGISEPQAVQPCAAI